MSAYEDYCELCDLPRSQCIHGIPPTPPEPRQDKPVKRAKPARPRKRAADVPSSAPVHSSAPDRRVPRRWTPPEVFKPLILQVLQGAGGELETDELFLELEILLEDRLLPGDHETTPEGELRWRYAARRARMALVSEGLMRRGRPGVWQLA